LERRASSPVGLAHLEYAQTISTANLCQLSVLRCADDVAATLIQMSREAIPAASPARKYGEKRNLKPSPSGTTLSIG